MKKFLFNLKELNPETQNINPQSIIDFDILYCGMTSRFHPEDIKYFYYDIRNNKNLEQTNKIREKIESISGVRIGFHIAANRAQKILLQAILITQNKNGSTSDLK
ncbi:MAG: hypothetical protein MJ187_03660 [Alphaproteobacteria bacterium]|nr:hypothetical protein [Alphaproteobacteria bacterium]